MCKSPVNQSINIKTHDAARQNKNLLSRSISSSINLHELTVQRKNDDQYIKVDAARNDSNHKEITTAEEPKGAKGGSSCLQKIGGNY